MNINPLHVTGRCLARPQHKRQGTCRILPVLLTIGTLLLVMFSAPSTADKSTLKIGVREVPPFVTRSIDGGYDGISIRLWREIAGELNLDYEFVEMDLNGLISGVRDGSLDAAVAALSVTPDREKFMDFSHPFYTAGLGIATTERPAGIWATVQVIFTWRFFQALGALLLVLLTVGVIVWLFERRSNPEQFGGRTHEGIGSGFWWSAVTMTTVGYGDKAPVTFWGRAIAVVWMFTSVITVSGFTAAIASVFTVEQLGTRVQGPNDLPGLTVATVPGSTSAEYLDRQRIKTVSVDSAREAIEAVSDQRADVAVYDAPIMRYILTHEYDHNMQVLPQEFARQDYAIGLPSDSPLREPINQTLLRHTATPVWQDTLFKYLGN